MSTLGLFLDSGAGTTAALLYVLMFVAAPLCMFWKPQLGVYLLVPFMPLQTLRYEMQAFPFGDKFIDLLLISVMLGLYFKDRGAFPARTRLNGFLIGLSIFTYVSLWLGSFQLRLPLPLSPSNPRLADWKNYAEMFLFFVVICSTIRTRRQMKILLCLMMVTVLRANLGFYHTVSERDFSHFDYNLRYAGVLGYAGENGLAAFEAEFALLLLGLFTSLRNWKMKALTGVSIGFALYCLMFSFSRGGYVGFLAGLLFLGLARERKYLIVLAVILLSWQTLVPNAVRERITMTYEDGQVDSSSGERVQLWQDAMTIIPKNPLLGTGFNTYKLLGRSEDYTDTHNYYMKVTVETGFVGLILFITLLLKMLMEPIALLRSTRDPFFRALATGCGAMMSCVIVVNIFGDRWMFPQVTAYMWVALAMVCRARLINQEELTAAEEAAAIPDTVEPLDTVPELLPA